MARLAIVVIQLLTILSIQRTLADLQVCNGKKIFILDINTFAEEANFPACKLDEAVVIRAKDGIPYLPNTTNVKSGEEGAFHIAAHGGPWHLYEAIRASTYNTEDPDEADFVYVYDHCLYMQWLAQVHTNGRVKPEGSPTYAGDILIRAYNAMLKSPLWQRRNGSNFIFYDPHPGFADGAAEGQFIDIMCNAARSSIHIVAETGQRNTCQDYWTLEKKLLVAPYVPGAVDHNQPLQGFEQAIVPLKQRETLLYWQGGCYPVEPAEEATIYTGKTLRYESALELGDVAPDVDVRCTDTTLGGQHLAFSKVIEDMRKSIFCLVLPGDSASARRTTEIFMSGCIPVFLGPPYGSMPFAKAVDYRGSSYVANVTQYGNWMNTPMLSENPLNDRPGHVQWIWFWVPDADIKQLGDSVLYAEKMKDIIPLLRSIPNKVVKEKLKSLDQERQKFAFQPSVTSQPSAINVVLEHICSTQTGGAAAEAPGSAPAVASRDVAQSPLDAQNRKVRGGIREASGLRLHDQSNYMIVQSAVQAAAHRYAAFRTGESLNVGLYKSAAAASVANEATRAAREMSSDG